MKTMFGFHAATDFGNLAIRIGARWGPVTYGDGDKEKTRQAYRSHLQSERISCYKVSAKSEKKKLRTN